MLRHPHLVFLIPGVIRSPDFQTNRVFAAGLGDEDPFRRMRDFGARNDHHFLRDTFVNENTIAFAHCDAILPSSLAIHGRKLSLANLASKLISHDHAAVPRKLALASPSAMAILTIRMPSDSSPESRFNLAMN